MPNPIICGPLVRKVTSASVSVFIALSEFRRISLHLYGDPAGAGLIGEATSDPRRIGKKLWVTVITVKGLNLQAGHNYHYDLSLFNGLDGSTDSLASLGFLQPDNAILGHPLGYEAGRLPGFALPPGLEHLNIVHGSCRKPHGYGPDQLAQLDDLIQATYQDPLARPHQLFLTGDQIYSDDVAADLFEKLTLEAAQLLGIQESITDVIKHGHTPTQAANRKAFVEGSTRLTSSHNDHHLVYLAEFYAMYLFAWSGYPLILEDLHQEHVFTPEVKEMRDLETGQVETIHIPVPLTAYAHTLPHVRRALANIPTFMMFDDHEVTDDWYMYGDWKTAALGHETTRRIIRNGLIAYAVFQDWGNQPEKYEDIDFFWDAVEFIPEQDGGGSIGVLAAPDASGPVNRFLGLHPTNTDGRHEWFFNLDYSDHHVYMLDTRTRRHYHGPYTQLIAPGDFDRQLPAGGSQDKVAVVIAPAPVLGMPIIEEAQRLLVKQSMRLKATTLDDEAWIGDPLTFNLLLSHLAGLKQVVVLSGDVHYGYTNSCAFFQHAGGQTARIVQLCSSSLKNGGMPSKAPTWLDHHLQEEAFAVYDAQDVDDVALKLNLIGKGLYGTVSRVFLKLNPRPGDIRTFSYEDLQEWQADLAPAMPVTQMRESYKIGYLDHELTTAYTGGGAFTPQEDLKIVGNTNIGQVTFEHRDGKLYVVHQMHLLRSYGKRIFLCKTLLTPPANTEKPAL